MGSAIDEHGVGFATAPVNEANPRPDNGAGHIIRWREGSDGTRFAWEVFVFGAAAADGDNRSGLTAANQFASPDGLWYDDRGDGQGILWIQTDNGYEGVTEHTNDQLLASGAGRPGGEALSGPATSSISSASPWGPTVAKSPGSSPPRTRPRSSSTSSTPATGRPPEDATEGHPG